MNAHRNSTAPYETLNTASQGGPLRSDRNVYDAPDQAVGPTHLYSSLKGESAAANTARNNTKSSVEDRDYDNTRGYRKAENNIKPTSEGVQHKVSSEAVVYSNLKLCMDNE